AACSAGIGVAVRVPHHCDARARRRDKGHSMKPDFTARITPSNYRGTCVLVAVASFASLSLGTANVYASPFSIKLVGSAASGGTGHGHASGVNSTASGQPNAPAGLSGFGMLGHPSTLAPLALSVPPKTGPLSLLGSILGLTPPP